MTFALLPAVDVAAGRSVRLAQGQAQSVTDDGDPLETALAFQNQGAQWIHLVDIDAAFGRGSNADLLATVTDALDIKVEMSGGIYDDNSLDRALATSCARIVLATNALANPRWCAQVIAAHGERIAVALDVDMIEQSDGGHLHRLAPRGRATADLGNLWPALKLLDDAGCARYVITDVRRDGMLRGPNLDLYRAIAQESSTPVIASGGIATMDDLAALVRESASGSLEGAVVGKALYTGRLTLTEALEATRPRR